MGEGSPASDRAVTACSAQWPATSLYGARGAYVTGHSREASAPVPMTNTQF